MTVDNEIDEMAERTRRAWSRPSWGNLLVVLPWALGLVFLIHEWRIDSQIAGRQQTASGIVTAHEPANHNRYGYKFQVDGKSYTGWESPTESKLAIGKQVTVFYDPQNPGRNALTDFHDVGTSVLGPVPMLLFGIGAVAAYIFYRRRRSAPTPAPQPRS
jgi:Protein of unknown function (DUF3592)